MIISPDLMHNYGDRIGDIACNPGNSRSTVERTTSHVVLIHVPNQIPGPDDPFRLIREIRPELSGTPVGLSTMASSGR